MWSYMFHIGTSCKLCNYFNKNVDFASEMIILLLNVASTNTHTEMFFLITFHNDIIYSPTPYFYPLIDYIVLTKRLINKQLNMLFRYYFLLWVLS